MLRPAFRQGDDLADAGRNEDAFPLPILAGTQRLPSLGMRLAHVDAAEGAATQAQNLQSNAVFAAWRLPIQVALGFERAQDGGP